MRKNFSETEWELIGVFLSGEANTTEKAELEELLRDPDKRNCFNEIKHIWETSSQAVKFEKYNSEAAFEKFLIKPGARQYESGILDRRFTLRQLLKIAAIFIVISGIFLCWLWLGKKRNDDAGLNTIMVRYGEQSQVTLSDGTNVWLNSGSRLVYPSSFNRKVREVTLDGEAYFDVTHHKQKLFIVNTSKVRVKVLGTAFNIKSYSNDNKIEATLVRGSVLIEKNVHSKKESPVVLKPGEKATFVFNTIPEKKTDDDKSSEIRLVKEKPVIIAKVDTVPITSWKKRALVFDNTSLEEMVVILERWFGIKVYLADESMKSFRYKGKFEHNENIFQVLEVIKITTPVNYEYKNHEIIMYLQKQTQDQ